MGTERIHDISVIGPGIWTMIHTLAVHAQDDHNVRLFKNYMYFLSQNFPCIKCREHIEKFLKTHPFENYTGDIVDGKEVGYFRLTWYMHSVVNERLKKSFFPFETAYIVFFEKETCMEICPGVIEEDDTTFESDDKSKLIMRMSKLRKDTTKKRTSKVSL